MFKPPFGFLGKYAIIGIIVTVVMYFISGKVFDFFVLALGPTMILFAVVMVIWFMFRMFFLDWFSRKSEDFKRGVKWYDSYFKKF